MTKLFEKRFGELESQVALVEATKQTKRDQISGAPVEYYDGEQLLSWCVKVRNLISNSCGENSQHFKSLEKAEKSGGFESNVAILRRLKAVFMAAKEDYEGGYVSSLKNIVQAEVFDSELDQATELLNSGYSVAAAVIAGTVLETTLRNLCDANGIAHGKLDKMNVDLAKVGVHNALVQKKITALAGIRNSAAHGKSAEFTKADVESMISEIHRYVENSLA
jgi:hypothetical protein